MSKGRTKMVIKKHASKTLRRLVTTLCGGLALVFAADPCFAQDIPMSGPLAGAKAVRKQRLHREGRFEIAPAATFTLLDEYQRQIMFGARLNYNFTDWLAIGVWGAHGTLKLPTGLSDKIDARSREIKATDAADGGNCESVECRLTEGNLGQNFLDQLGGFNWMAVPQLTIVPFRGKIALFQSAFVDTDLYFFVGAAFINVNERVNCDVDCSSSFATTGRTAWTISEGLGLNFYLNRWAAIGTEFRMVPFAWNTAGFDVSGGGPNQEFPDNQISDADRQFKFNPMMTVSFSMHLPFDHRVSD